MARKRKVAPTKPLKKDTKRAKISASQPQDFLIIEDSDEVENADPELQDILAQIKAQEERERFAKQEAKQPVASGSKDLSNGLELDVDDNEADPELQEMLAQIKAQEESERVAKRLQEEFDKSDTFTGLDSESSEIKISSPIPSPPSMKGAASTSKGDTKESRKRTHQDNPSPPQLVRPDQSLEPFRDVFTGSRTCTKCGKQVKSPRGYVAFSQSASPPSLLSLLHAPCTSCHTNHCRGCFSPVSCPTSCKGAGKNSKCKILECCAEGRAIAIFETLGGFDQQYIVEQSASRSRAAKIAKNAHKVSSVGPGGTGYGISHNYQLSANKDHKKQANPPASSTWEKAFIHSLKVLIDLLPAPYCDNPKTFDLLPHPSIGYLISLSQMPIVLESLLRNDSVTDWIFRKETYNIMLSLLRRMADCELTIRCLIGQRCEAVTSCGIQEWMWQTGDIVLSQDSSGQLEISPPLYTYFKKLTRQSESFLVGAMSMLGEEQNQADVEETVIQAASLCGDIIAARDDLERAINILGEASSTPPIRPETQVERLFSCTKKSHKGKGPALAIEFDKVYAETCERLAFEYVSLADGMSYASYNYARELETTQNSTRLPQNRFHLLKELATTSTSLPPGIWVRVDEVRNDAIKVMIAGPDGTPYAGGLFEFDCLLPLDYPNRSPLMHLRTTGCGTVAFNPNLYNCGKVCLSLLGTWSGSPEEQWHPGRSTLLQVLISIQSMILNDVPYFNEPGHGQANPKNSASIAYNKDICAKTVKWAIVDWLKDHHRKGIWREVIASHFKINKDKIRARIVEWSKTVSTIRSYPNSGDLLAQFDNGMGIIDSWGNVDGTS